MSESDICLSDIGFINALVPPSNSNPFFILVDCALETDIFGWLFVE